MRKISYYLLLTFIITGCDSKEDLSSKKQSLNNPMQLYIINGDIEHYFEITDGSKLKKPILVYDTLEKTNDINGNIISKTFEQSTFLNFHYGVAASTKSGCTVTRYMESGKTYETDAGVYGPNPAPQNNGYLVRGYGVPHQNTYYGALVLMAANKGAKRNTERGVWHENANRGAAISIEYPFKKNITYEIKIKTKFHDNLYSINKIRSSGYPTLYVQLKDDPIITSQNLRNQNQDPCKKEDLNDVGRYGSIDNYKKSYSPDSNIETIKDVTFQFSPIDEKKALVLSLHPTIGIEGYGLPIPTNSFTLILLSVTITEKPFDTSLNIPSPNIPSPRGYDPQR